MNEDEIAKQQYQRRLAAGLSDCTKEELALIYCQYIDDYTLSLMNGLMEEVHRRGLALTDLEDYCT